MVASLLAGAATTTILACGGPPPDLVARAELTLQDGTAQSLEQVKSTTLTLTPVAMSYAGIESLELQLGSVVHARQRQRVKLLDLELVDGATATGRAQGSLEGLGPDGPTTVEWSEITEVTFSWNHPPPSPSPPPGPRLTVTGDGVTPFTLEGTRVQEAWIIRHGKHMYRRDTKVIEILPFTVKREEMVWCEWEIPLPLIKQVDITPALIEVEASDAAGRRLHLEGVPGAGLRRYHGDAAFVGTSEIGTWTLSLTKLQRIARQQPGQQGPVPPRIRLELVGGPEPTQPAAEPTALGNCTTWDSETYPVIACELEVLQLRHGEEVREINPGDLRSVKVFASPWDAYDERSTVEQWLPAELTLADGVRLTGELLDHFGYVTCPGPPGTTRFFASYALRELALAPARP